MGMGGYWKLSISSRSYSIWAWVDTESYPYLPKLNEWKKFMKIRDYYIMNGMEEGYIAK